LPAKSTPRTLQSKKKDEAVFSEIVELISASREKALQAVNTTLIDLYWEVGATISRKIEAAEWGDGVVEQLAEYIARTQPGLRGFTRANLFRMRQFPELVTMSTMDLFTSESVRSHLGHDLLKDAIFMALLHGRMQVPKIHLDWVLELIGPEKAIQCLSLPSFARVLTLPDVAKQGRKSQQR
jgi:DUF1016 N-terminal domain